MIDAISAKERLRRLSPNRWEHRWALCFIAAAIVLALMCEARASDMPPFKLAHPLCGAGFATITQRIDTRDRFGIIIKRENVTGCAKGKIIYGGKV